jgi:uncharacterized protein (TIGR02996 family)
MITLEIRRHAGVAERIAFEGAEVNVGRRADVNHLVLPGDEISDRHARFVEKDERLIIVDLKSDSGVYVNGRRITSPLVVRENDALYIGDYMLRGSVLLPVWPDDADVTPIVEAMEIRLLDSIAQGDDPSRLIYADWLEERGRPERAEWLRLVAMYDTANDVKQGEIRERLRELAQIIERRWRLRVARPRIERCTVATCPREWAALGATDRRHVRACGACGRDIYYCSSARDAVWHDVFGDRVAVELHALPDRWGR